MPQNLIQRSVLGVMHAYIRNGAGRQLRTKKHLYIWTLRRFERAAAWHRWRMRPERNESILLATLVYKDSV